MVYWLILSLVALFLPAPLGWIFVLAFVAAAYYVPVRDRRIATHSPERKVQTV